MEYSFSQLFFSIFVPGFFFFFLWQDILLASLAFLFLANDGYAHQGTLNWLQSIFSQYTLFFFDAVMSWEPSLHIINRPYRFLKPIAYC